MPTQLPEELGSITTAVSERDALSTVPPAEKGRAKYSFWAEEKALTESKDAPFTWGSDHGTGTGSWLQGSSAAGGSGGDVMEVAERPAQQPRDLRWPGKCRPCASQVDGGEGCCILLTYLLARAHQQREMCAGNPVVRQSCL